MLVHAAKKKSAPVARRADGAKLAETKAAAEKEKLAAAKEVANPLSGLVLNATYLNSSGGAAIINGKVYVPGDQVNGDPNGKPIRLAAVHIHRVMLDAAGSPLELAYDVAPGSAKGRAAPDAAAPAKSKPAARAAAPASAPKSRRRAR